MPRPAVLFAERASDSLARGYDQMAELVAQTLGPTQGMVLSQREHREPEMILDAASAVRRIIEMPDRAVNIGAMLMRHTAWQVHLRCGDGAATAAVLAQALLREAVRYVRAGGNAMLVKRGVERAMGAAIDALAAQAQPVTGEEALTRAAQTITGEPNISLVLGEMFDVLGPTAHITVEDYAAPYLEHVYFEGGRWRGALASPYLVTDPASRRAIQENCRVVLYAGKLGTVDDVMPMLTLLAQGDNRQRPLLLVADDITGPALNTLLTNHDRGVLKILAVRLRTTGEAQAEDLMDLATITGAGVLGPEYGRKLSTLTPDDVGGARRAEASADELLITGGAGDPATRRARVDGLRTQLAALGEKADGQDRLRLRLGRVAGGVGVLKVGAHTSAERQSLTQKVEKAIRALRIAMVEGIVPGGGAAYLPPADAAKAMAATLEGDERQGALILSRALEEPFRRIVRNRGATAPATALAEVRRCGPGYTYDALADRVVPASAAGILDPAGVLRVALEAGVSGAMSALTVAVMVFHRRPSEALEP